MSQSNETHFFNWSLVIINILMFSLFVLAFIRPIKKRDWRALGLYEAFIISLFTEMYGIPLTIYLLSSTLGFPLSANHSTGHLLATLLSLLGVWDLEIGVAIVMMTSTLMLMLAGYLLIAGWLQLYRSREALVTDGLYSIVRHPQYLGIMIGTGAFLIQWPTVLTVIMWPVLTYTYYRQALKEEREMEKKFGEKYHLYKQKVPMLIPRLKRK